MAMMREKRNEDLFRESTMTFGEHLEELRTCLWRAVIGLVLGFVVGLFVAQSVIAWIQKPLEQALQTYRTTQAKEKVQKRIDEYVAKGYPANVAEVVGKTHMIPKRVLVFPHELLEKVGVTPSTPAAASSAAGAASKTIDRPESEKSKKEVEDNPLHLVEITLWQPVEESEGVRSTSLSVHEPFTLYIKASLLVGLILS
ncbi:MAG: twin-arginine translocase subunit TatC, partial [Thermoguttaceae bacterium]